MMPTVLVADESRGNRQLMTRQLRAMGWQAIETSDGLETLDRLTERDADFVILDMSLRLLSAVEILTALRRSVKYAELPVVCMGVATSSALETLVRLGVDDFLVKPFTSDFLRDRLQRFPPKANVRVRAATASGGTPVSGHGMAVVVDADAQFRDFAAKVLAAHYRVVEAASGVDALRACAGHRPALVLTSSNTGLLGPGLLAEHLAKRPDTARTAVVLVKSTNEDDATTPVTGFSAVLTKTFVVDDFERQMARVLGRSLVNGSAALKEVRQAVEAATQQVLGMMAGCDVRVVSTERAHSMTLRAWTDLSMPEESVAVRMVLRADSSGAASIAASLLGASPEDLAPEDGLAALGELVNVIAGRVKSTVTTATRTLAFGFPELASTGEALPPEQPEVCLLLEPADGRFRLGVELDISSHGSATSRAKAA